MLFFRYLRTGPGAASSLRIFQGLYHFLADFIQVPCKRVAESPIQFECEYFQTIHIPSRSNRGVIDMVLGKVLEVHIADEVLTPDGRIDFLKIKPLGRMGYFDYTYVNEVFTMPIPGLSTKQMESFSGEHKGK